METGSVVDSGYWWVPWDVEPPITAKEVAIPSSEVPLVLVLIEEVVNEGEVESSVTKGVVFPSSELTLVLVSMKSSLPVNSSEVKEVFFNGSSLTAPEATVPLSEFTVVLPVVWGIEGVLKERAGEPSLLW